MVCQSLALNPDLRENVECIVHGKWRPDETATGERGEVLSDEAMTFGEFYELYDLMYEEIAVLESESDSLDRDTVNVSAILKEYGWDVRRISGDGTSERRADNAENRG